MVSIEQTELPALLEQFKSILSADIGEVIRQNVTLTLPHARPSQLITMNRIAKDIFASEPILLKIDPEIVVVGDLHGSILDLVRIFQQNGLPPSTKYLFLGDLVDRGEFSLEVLTFVFLLKVVYPKQIFVIRGNHEFEQLCSPRGLAAEVSSEYNDSISVFQAFADTFSYLPVAAIIGGRAICLHGGIGPDLFSLSQIISIPRPIKDFSLDVMKSIMWSDPSEGTTGFPRSNRYLGYLFGESDIELFLNTISMRILIRGHEMVQEGVKFSLNNRVVTVFSSSNYCGAALNMSGIIRLDSNAGIKPYSYPPLPYFKRSQANFHSIEKSNSKEKELFSAFAFSSGQLDQEEIVEKGHRKREALSHRKEIVKPSLVSSKSVSKLHPQTLSFIISKK